MSLIPSSTITGTEIVAKDWDATPLGSIGQWPMPLRSTVALMLACPTPMFLAWGSELRCFYNDAYRPILGFRLPTALGAPFREVWGSIWDDIQPLVTATLAGEGRKMVDMPLDLSRDGEPEESWWTFTYSPVYDEHGEIAGLLCVTSEQTDRIHTEKTHVARAVEMTAEIEQRRSELAQAEEQLRQSQKLEAIGQLTGGVAHDFNNLLTVIRGSVDLLRREDLTPERRARYIDAIGDTADRAAKLTGQLLAFARRQALKPETLDVGASIAETANIVRTLTGSRIELELHTPQEQVFVLADRSQLDTAIVNMAVNARDAMNGEGRLVIATGPVSGVPAIRSHEPVAGDFIAVTITDTGAGIAPDQIGRIFEPFFTTKGAVKARG